MKIKSIAFFLALSVSFFQQAVGVNTADEQALFQAAKDGDEAAVDQYLQAGVDVNVTVDDAQDFFHGWTALHIAVYKSQNIYNQAIEMLVNAPGIDLNQEIVAQGRNFNGWTALHLAVFKCFDLVVDQLIVVPGIDVNHKVGAQGADCLGWAPLHIAALTCDPNLIVSLCSSNDLFVEAKVENNQSDFNDMTAFQIFQEVVSGNQDDKLLPVILMPFMIALNGRTNNDDNDRILKAILRKRGYFNHDGTINFFRNDLLERIDYMINEADDYMSDIPVNERPSFCVLMQQMQQQVPTFLLANN